MKMLLITICIATVTSTPIPDKNNTPIEIVNGVYEGKLLKVGEILDAILNQDTNKASTDFDQPYYTVSVVETILLAKQSTNPHFISLSEPIPASVVPTNESLGPVIQLKPISAESVSEFFFPDTVDPETNITWVTSEPFDATNIPYYDNIASSFAPEIDDIPEEVPSPAAQNSEFYNDEITSLSIQGSESPGMLSTLQSWFNMVLNYFNSEGDESTEESDSETI